MVSLPLISMHLEAELRNPPSSLPDGHFPETDGRGIRCGASRPLTDQALGKPTHCLASRTSPSPVAYVRGSEEWRSGNGCGGAGHGPDRAGRGQRAGTLGAVTVTAVAAWGCWRHLHEVLCKK